MGATYTLDAFVQAQAEHKVLTVQRLEEFYEAVRDAVQGACDTALMRFEQEVAGASAGGEAAAAAGSSTPRAQQGRGGEGVKRSFLQQAQLRSVCKKITNYIRVVDYIVLSTLHQLLMSSLGDLHHLFESVPPGFVEKKPEEEEEEEPDNLLLNPKAASKSGKP